MSFLAWAHRPLRLSLGTLIRIGNDYLFSGEWWITVFPGHVVLIALSVNLLVTGCATRSTPPGAEQEQEEKRSMSLQVKTCCRIPKAAAVPCALDDVASIAPGEILGVVGESGAGKSLTGAAIIGLLEPPAAGLGQILLEGQRIDNLNNSREMRHIRAAASVPSSRTR